MNKKKNPCPVILCFVFAIITPVVHSHATPSVFYYPRIYVAALAMMTIDFTH
jgi:hypothetical protein